MLYINKYIYIYIYIYKKFKTRIKSWIRFKKLSQNN